MSNMTFDELVASGLNFDEISTRYGEETAINVGIARDPDAAELGSEWFARARPAVEVVPNIVERARRVRGKQRTPTKGADLDPAGRRRAGALSRIGPRLAVPHQ